MVPWEKNLISSIERAILESNIGLNPSSVGDLIKVPMPPCPGEKERVNKSCQRFAEDCKVSIRNIRREANEASKKKLKTRKFLLMRIRSFKRKFKN